MLPSSHHGSWKGLNRLWFEDPAAPEKSDGTLEVESDSIAVTWSFRGAAQRGEIVLAGPAPSLRADWKDTWHAADGMSLHGHLADGVLRLFGTYSGGDTTWGWRIEVDFRDPEHCVLRMFNVDLGGGVAPAVDLHGARLAAG